MTLRELVDFLPGWLLRAAVIWFGLIWGSFLNVVIYRVPLGMSVVRPASHCPGCGKPVAGYDNVPVLSYVILRGRARCCGARMSPRYPLVELIGGALSLAILEGIVLRLSPGLSVGRAAAIYGADLALCLGLVAAAFIDVEHMFIPDSISYSGMVLGITTATIRGFDLKDAVIGAVFGFLLVWFPLGFLYKGFRGRTGMGMGDAKLVALAGAWFGWQGALFALFAGAFQGTLYTLVTWVLGIEHKLPDAVQKDIDELRKAADEGDEEARKELEEDPLTEDEDPFILTFLGRLYRRILRAFGRDVPEPSSSATSAEGMESSTDDGLPREEDDIEEPPRRHMPFGPFLILATLEMLFLGDWINDRLFGLLSP